MRNWGLRLAHRGLGNMGRAFNFEEAAELNEAASMREPPVANNPRKRTRKTPCPLCDGKRLHTRDCPVAILIDMRSEKPSDGLEELAF